MPRDSNGNASTDPVYVATPGTTIRAVQHNTPIADIIQMLTGSLARNGAGGMLADLNMNGFTITNLAGGGLAPADGAVTTAKIAANAVTPAKLALGAWTDVASASTVDLGAQASRNLVITGTTTITSFGTAGAADNVPYLVRFAAALTLTNGASLILPGAANITTAADDVAVVVHDTTSIWRVVSYIRAANAPRVVGTAANNLVALDGTGKLPAVDASQLTNLPPALNRAVAVNASGTAIDFTGTPATAKKVTVVLSGVSTNGAAGLLIQLGDAASIKTTGYSSSTTYAFSNGNGYQSPTNGIGLFNNAATQTHYACIEIYNVDGNTWVASGNGQADPSVLYSTTGVITLASVLTRLRLTTANGTDTFDAGKVNIFWE